MAYTMAERMGDEMAQCVSDCVTCYAACTETAAYCLGQGGPLVESELLTTLADCANVCQTSADFMLRGSPLHTQTCALCAAICDLCADRCIRSGEDDQFLKDCAEVCAACAQSCQRMAALGR